MKNTVNIISLDDRIEVSDNYALQKVAKYYTLKGWRIISDPSAIGIAEKTYISILFTQNRCKAEVYEKWDGVKIGGSGWDVHSKLPPEIEAMRPKLNYGFTTRGCNSNRACPWCIVRSKEGRIRPVADLYDLWNGIEGADINLLDNNILQSTEHFLRICEQAKRHRLRLNFTQGLDWREFDENVVSALKGVRLPPRLRIAFDDMTEKKAFLEHLPLIKQVRKEPFVYAIVGYNTTYQEDLERLDFLWINGCRPFVMKHKNVAGIKKYTQLADYTNNKAGYYPKYDYEEYQEYKKHEYKLKKEKQNPTIIETAPVDNDRLQKRYKFADLFAGAGGFHLALKPFADCVFASEWDEHAQQIYKLNHLIDNEFPVAGDITEVSEYFFPDHDILCGGFPCQPWSIAGTQAGFDHAQGNLFYDIKRILGEKLPAVVFLENVKNLVSHNGGETLEAIEESLLIELGYKLHYGILNAKHYGNLPQNRDRIYIVGFQEQEMYDRFTFPKEIPLKTRIFGDIINLSEKAPQKYYQTNMSSPAVLRMHEEITKKYVIYQSRRSKIQANKSGVSPCLTASMGTGGHNVPLILDDYGIRKLTPKECFLLQGFPPDFRFPEDMKDSHLYKQAGNSIPLGVVSRIAENIIKTFEFRKQYGNDSN